MTANNASKKPEASKSAQKKAPEPTAKKKLAGKASKNSVPMTSKADLIRKVAGIIKAKGEVVRPKDIVEILKKEGVDVFPAQVSMTLKAAGYRPLRKRRKGKKTAEGIAAKKSVGASRANQISIDDLLAAKSVAGAFGGTDKAIAALQALKKFES